MGKEGPIVFTDADKMADWIVETAGKDLVMGMQLGLGKPNNIANALYRKAENDPSINLRIITALSLEKPQWSSELERRFLEPLIERVWGGYVDLDYAAAVREKRLPPNVSVSEFFYKAGAFLSNPHMQQNYISTNYTHAARDVVAQGMNVAGALLAKGEVGGVDKYSVSCNGDTALDALKLLREEDKRLGRKSVAVGEINENLPFMYGDAVVDTDEFDAVLQGPQSNFTLFGAPKESVNTTDYLIGVNASSLIKDDGTLQIGIGSLGDAIAYGLTVRQNNNELYKELLKDTGLLENSRELIERWGGTGVFEKGLYGSTEMFVDSFYDLYKNGIMKRFVYDNYAIQKLVNDGLAEDGAVTPEFFKALVADKAIGPVLSEEDFDFLVEFGVLKEGLVFENKVIKDGGNEIACDLQDAENIDKITATCLGDKLKNEFWMHAGFFLGPTRFYDGLNNMSEEERKKINMTSVLNVNQIAGATNDYASEELKILQRKNGRFINAGLMVTLSGAICSDGLSDGRVVSGVGGQFNFVCQAHEIPGARGGIMIRSTRTSGGETVSNIVYNYGHTTVPRHLRDLVITEYGVADLKSQSDKEIIKRLLNVTDSRFQSGLLEKAKAAGKIEADYEIPEKFRNNTPAKLEKVFKKYKDKGLFDLFPFGTAFTDEEVSIGKALKMFKAQADKSKFAVAKGLLSEYFAPVPENAVKFLERMQLQNPSDFKEKMMQKVVILALKTAGEI